MSLDERRRHELHDRLQGMIGAEPAATLMDLLVEMRDDIARLDTRVDRLDSKIDQQGELLRAEMAALRTELVGEFRGEVMAAMISQTRTVFLGFGGMMIAFVGLVLGLKLL
jgi:hypothetical protein